MSVCGGEEQNMEKVISTFPAQFLQENLNELSLGIVFNHSSWAWPECNGLEIVLVATERE